MRAKGSYTEDDNPVVDAFRAPKFLVQLTFTRQSFVVAVDSAEARNAEEAETVALRRANKAIAHLGRLSKFSCLPDNEKNRQLLKVDGSEFGSTVEHSPHWWNAA